MLTTSVNPTLEIKRQEQLIEDIKQDDFYLVQMATSNSLALGLSSYKLDKQLIEFDIMLIKVEANRAYDNYISHIQEENRKEVTNI